MAAFGDVPWKAACAGLPSEGSAEMSMLILGAIILAAAQPSGEGSANPLAPAADGQVQCYQPNEQKRTCRSIASYQRKADGAYANTATVLVSIVGPVTLETVTPVRIEEGAVCGTIRMEDIVAGKLRIAGRLLSGVEAAPILARIAKGMTPLIDKIICTKYEQSADGLTAKATVGGQYRADADQRVIWVRLDAGYVVSPD